MFTITNPKIERYLKKLSAETDPLLLAMERMGHRQDFPIVDRLVGRLLYLLTRLKDPKLVVELGSGFGYSAYWFARALNRGKVILTEHDRKNIDLAKKTFIQAGLAQRAVFHVGDAIEMAKRYKGIDILFIDIDKHQYLTAVKTLLPNLSRNALIIADNTLWYGKVAGKRKDRETQGIQAFNEYLFSSNDFFTTIVPLRDGVLLAHKIR
jgi:predicted O-methyltransferase YrrM